MVRIAHDPETTHYFERRVKEGRTKRDIIRILQRYIAREAIATFLATESRVEGLAHPLTVAPRG